MRERGSEERNMPVKYLHKLGCTLEEPRQIEEKTSGRLLRYHE
jgi:hypothetical protein